MSVSVSVKSLIIAASKGIHSIPHLSHYTRFILAYWNHPLLLLGRSLDISEMPRTFSGASEGLPSWLSSSVAVELRCHSGSLTAVTDMARSVRVRAHQAGRLASQADPAVSHTSCRYAQRSKTLLWA
jgi:hypothetical protein